MELGIASDETENVPNNLKLAKETKNVLKYSKFTKETNNAQDRQQKSFKIHSNPQITAKNRHTTTENSIKSTQTRFKLQFKRPYTAF